MKIRRLVLAGLVLVAVVATTMASAVSAAQTQNKISIGLQGEMLTQGTPHLSIEFHKGQKSMGFNLGYASPPQEYPEYPSGYNKSQWRVYMAGVRIGHQIIPLLPLPWGERLNFLKPYNPYMVGEFNKIWVRTDWISAASSQKALILGVKIFPLKKENLYLIFEAGLAQFKGAGDAELGVSETSKISETYNIGVGWEFPMGVKKTRGLLGGEGR